jgi:7,8-dihydropterin-6-yl-methyl-4-(beta-D-ribofuranosyl)aminobenzene 5'-phosphate synthase
LRDTVTAPHKAISRRPVPDYRKGGVLASTNTKITILVDNNVLDQAALPTMPTGLASEHGLSFWIERAGQHVLLDTGQGRSLEVNAPSLGIDLATTDTLVLSHGHYDHSGGLAYALEHSPRARVYCHPAVLQTRYSVQDGKAKSIGMPRRPRRALKRLEASRVRWVLGPTMLSDCIGLTGPIPRITDYEDTGGPFYLDTAGWRPDPLEDDMALWIRADKGLVVCLGCAHSGVVSTLDYVQRLNPGMKIRAVIGGLHLGKAGPERLEKTAQALLAANVPLVVPCHCTGPAAVQALTATLGGRLRPGASGSVLEF